MTYEEQEWINRLTRQNRAREEQQDRRNAAAFAAIFAIVLLTGIRIGLAM